MTEGHGRAIRKLYMVIGIDIRILGSPRRSGIVEYTEQLLSRMIRAAPEHRFKLFYSSFRHALPNYAWLSAGNVELHARRIPNNLLFMLNRLFDWPKLDVMLGGVDVFFSPHLFIASLSDRCRRITVFHDLSYLRFPEFFTIYKRLWHTLEMNPARQVRLSHCVIAVSASTKSDLVRYYGIDPANVRVVHSGVALTRPSPERIEEYKARHQLPDRFVLSLSTLEPRKNIIAVIHAFTILKESPGFEDLRLIVGGERGWLHRDLFEAIEHSPAQRYIRYLGYVPDGDRAALYAVAEAFVYPSFFEGFGFPILEAMACGTPVITSHNSSMPEVAGDAALLINPYDVSDIASAMRSIITDHHLRQRLVARGIARATEFDWDHTVAETLEIIIRT